MSKPNRASAQIVSQSTKERCRKGDLAIRLNGKRVGHIVEVVEYHATVELDSGEVLIDAWQVRHETDDPDTDYFKEDKYLLPIRPSDLEETEVDELMRKEGDAEEVRHG